MDQDVEAKKRDIIPRWRDFKTTLSLGELNAAGKAPADEVPEGSLDEQLADWRVNKSLFVAADLVGAAFTLGKGDVALEAAEFILSEESQANDLQKRIARQATDPQLCARLSGSQEIEEGSNSELIINQSRELVRKYRAQLREAPRNPVKLVELSRRLAILGSQKKALRAMDMAVALAPANRFVVRSAARLLVHAEEFDRAHDVLKRAPSLKSDPWLLAAEIGVSSLMDRTSGHLKRGLTYIGDDNFSPFEVSELSSAVATLEMNNANTKLARKLFRRALRKPTENSIAQAVWASRSIQTLSDEIRNASAPRNYEALAWEHYQQQQLDDAISQGTNWILDQPFAIGPVLFTAHAAALVENYQFGEEIVRFGLRANPQNALLRNNLAFVLASDNEPRLAEVELEKIDRTQLTVVGQIVITATEGLIRFRKGLPDEGRALYKRAIKLAEENNEPGYALRALIYLAREEINAGTILGPKTLENAEKEAEGFYLTHEVTSMLKRLRKALESDPAAFATAVQMKNKSDENLSPKSRDSSS